MAAPAKIATLRPARRLGISASLRTIAALCLREMQTSYGRSPGGYLWAVMEPVAGIALLTFIFSLGFRAPPIGSNFPIFYATGIVPFTMYRELSGKIAQSISYSRPLLKYPRVTIADALLARFALNVFTQLLVAYVIFAGIELIYETRTVPDLPGIALGLSMVAMIGFGVGVMNCLLFGLFPVWQQVWAILSRPLFIISCIFFTFETVPEPYRGLLWYNPLVHITGQLRAAFYPTYDASYVSPAYVFGLGLGLCALGLVLLGRYHRDILNG